VTDSTRRPYTEAPVTVRLSWKTRKTPPGSEGSPDYGSFYAILPKGQVRQLGWGAQQDLVSRIEDGKLVFSPVIPNGRATRPPKLSKPPLDQFLHGDVLEELARIPDNSVHLTVTSPPYNLGVDYTGYDDAREYGNFRRWLKEVWRELFRVTVRGGRFALNTAPTSISNYHPVQIDLTNDAREVGFEFRAQLVWYKQNMTAKRTAWGSFRRPSNPHVIPSWEYVDILQKYGPLLEGRKEDADITSKEFVDWSDGFWAIAPESSRPTNHPSPFPEQLVERLAKFYSFQGNTILDPFGGSGTVAAVAKRTRRHFIYIDQADDYVEFARRRVAKIHPEAQE
jgi:modification methylase